MINTIQDKKYLYHTHLFKFKELKKIIKGIWRQNSNRQIKDDYFLNN